MGLYILPGFVTVNFSWKGSLIPSPTLNVEDHGLYFICPKTFDLPLVVLPRTYTPTSIALKVIAAHDKTVVLEEALLHLVILTIFDEVQYEVLHHSNFSCFMLIPIFWVQIFSSKPLP
jgi:hypothetical protein